MTRQNSGRDLRLLYVGSLGANGQDRMDALRNCGFEVSGFDIAPYRAFGLRIERSVAARFSMGRGVRRLNRELLQRARRADYDVLVVDKGNLIRRETLLALRNGASMRTAVHYTPDAQFLENRSRHFLASVPEYDLLVTTKLFEVEHYRHAGAQDLLVILQGFGRRITMHSKSDVPEELRSEICFIGHCQSHYAARLSKVASMSHVAIWGPNWPRYARVHAWARPCVRGDGLWHGEYAQALSAANIAIGLLSKRIPETSTTRSFEIPASGTFMLAERSDEHASLFAEGKEAEFFGDDDELCEKARFYLRNDTARERIAAAGRERCLRSGYKLEDQFQRIATWIFQHTGTGARS